MVLIFTLTFAASTPAFADALYAAASDADVMRFLKLFTDLPLDRIAELARLDGAAINDAKVVLANEATALLHGRDAAASAEATARDTFAGGGTGDDLPTLRVAGGQIHIVVALTGLGLAVSKGEVRRKIAEGAVKIDGVTVSDPALMVVVEGPTKLSLGKKRHGLLTP